MGSSATGYNPALTQLDPRVCYRALRTRDRRFDGRFFTAVRTTGVYCRPICPAPTPRLANCSFVPSAAAAHELGYRPCLRCRPEAAPGSPAWSGTSATVNRALRLIGQGELDTDSVETLAAKLGVGARHLRRLFARHLGASPVAVAQTRRVHFAKRLIDDSDLPFAEIAFAAGYSSVRRFNDSMQRAYGRPPGALRRARGAQESGELGLLLPFRPPLLWRDLLEYLRVRGTPGVEAVTGDSYRRTLSIDGACGWVEISRARGQPALRARIQLSDWAPLIRVVERLRQALDLDADPTAIAAHLRRDSRLGRVADLRPGLRIPGSFCSFELSVRAILGQQVSVRAATTLAGRLAAAFGRELEDEGSHSRPAGLKRLFPEPAELMDASIERIGIPRTRADAIRALARAVTAGELCLDGSASPTQTRAALEALPGIGRWTSDYVALRALREPDAFPLDDLGLLRAAAENSTRLTPRELARRAESWRPWRGYAALYLWQRPRLEDSR